jgi:hypothetical protein
MSIDIHTSANTIVSPRGVISPTTCQHAATGIAKEGAEILGHVVTYIIKKARTYESKNKKSIKGITIPARRLGGIDDPINGSSFGCSMS